jgi:glycosyltransferase involved in cell wall biosynthesis
LKILFILGFPNPFAGAAWTRIGFFTEAWSNKGHKVEILGTFSRKTPQKRGRERFGKVNIFNLVFNVGLSHPLVFTMNSLVSFIVSTFFLLAKKPNVTIVSVPPGDVGLGALITCKLFKVRYAIDYRDEWEDYAITLTNRKMNRIFYSVIRQFSAILYAKSQLVVAVTPNYMASLKRRRVTNVKLVPNGADTRIFRPSSSQKEGFIIFYSGGIGGYYRLDVAVKALKRLMDKELKNIKLVIAGSGEVQKIRDLALELGVSNNIEYKGVINDKPKLARLISESGIGLIPYDDNPLWKNTLPAKFFEYCACGIPVIATAYEGSLIAELIRKYEVGVVSPPMDEEKLAEAIFRIYKNRVLREEAGKRARALIEEKFDRNKIAEEYFTLIKALI